MRKLNNLLLPVVFLSFFVSGMGWILASPLGGSPDEDFHMGSIWCPRPVSESCQTKVIDELTELRSGSIWCPHKNKGTCHANARKEIEAVVVPETVGLAAACHAFQPARSAECTLGLSDKNEVYSIRYDDGSYPRGYYRFHHLFVGDNVGSSVLVMRAVNLLIALVLLSSVFVVLPARYRQRFFFSLLVAWMPMGWYFINSLNPSSWSITGVIVYASALFASSVGEGYRRWFALLVASAGALLCICSRGDAAFFIFVASLAVIVGSGWSRWHRIHRIFIFVWSLVGLYFMASGGQAGNVASVQGGKGKGFLSVLLKSLLDFPEYIAGLWGRLRGPGWFDTSLDGPVTILALIVAGGFLFIELRGKNWRRYLSAGVVVGTIFIVPFVTTLKGVQPSLFAYQPRYMLPLLAVFYFVLLVLGQETHVSTSHKRFVVGCEIVVFSLALKRVLWRYVSGMEGAEPLVNLDRDIKWWWDIPAGPTAVWIIATFAFAIATIFTVKLSCDPGNLTFQGKEREAVQPAVV